MTSRFVVHYRIFASSRDEAAERAAGIALEQTVEIPRDVVPRGYIEDEIVGRIESLAEEDEGRHLARISYSPDSVGAELPQLLNVMFGNSSIQKGIKVVGLDLGATLAERFPGARFGVDGVRRRAGRPAGGLIAPVIKPQGSDADTLAGIAYRCALAGADVVKDDHGLTDQAMAPFRTRCEKVASAVARANRETGGSCLYFPNLAGRSDDLMDFAGFARDCGAGGVLVIPGLFGFDLIRRLAADETFDLPIMAHPSFLGSSVLSDTFGFTHGMMFGVLQRLAGADISIFPNVGGRFGFSAAECLDIAGACRDPAGVGRRIFPSPGGGMSVERAGDMKQMYGDDVVFLLGGSLLRYGDRIGEAITAMRSALRAANGRAQSEPAD
ncbi:ribulose 1,5-bisphosphate carboxylase large subunit [Roseiarcus fermentans]|uniref:Ribulose 1,5-bisphosphate carboxylase large subunit n=1 Tax=Roseiarcus fermentans TaxID=1473586 RepID=A0A366FRJ3_9HYPH|nr:RuBisCO large subunit C-terminal-like domain-containing protein [Roseiarcus fermentans]RBP17272.1 ribulose 1,5-bisphosphate carboxylase large subunit [Roseiarcus fermentans]